MPGARCTRSLVCKMKKTHERRHHRFTGITRHSLRDGFTAYSVLSPVCRACSHRRYAGIVPAKLDASVGASGPHGFAVRNTYRSSHDSAASIASRPTSVTMANAPLLEQDARINKEDSPDGASDIFFQKGLDTILSIRPTGGYI